MVQLFYDDITKSLKRLHPSVATALALIPFLTLPMRKIVLTMCQLQISIMHPLVYTEFQNVQSLYPSFKVFPSQPITVQDMKNFDIIVSSTMVASLIWMVLRVVPEPDAEIARQAWVDGFLKEYQASQQIFSPDQIFGYEELFDLPVEDPISPSWVHRARTISTRLSVLLRRLPILFPKVNRSKNVSRDSAILYSQRYPDADITKVSTRDLEVHYARTGEKITGPCEMRCAWKFNDLKPRVYYAQGGKDYFASRYMKNIAVAFMEAFDMTNVANRLDPTRKLNQEYWFESWMTTWDLSSFTTNLSELKFFLYWVTELLAQSNLPDLTLLDYADGLVQVPVHELLFSYNEIVNLNSEFSIHRIIDRFGLDVDNPYPRQANNGMLGVPGNIGFSTALHGVVAAKANGPDYTICVGDDAIAMSWLPPEDNIIPTIESLGVIAREKFSIMPPASEGFFKFLKRRFSRSQEYCWISFLFSIPIFVTIDGIVPPQRTPPLRFELYDRLYASVSHLGKLLWDLYGNAYLVEDDDLEILSIVCSRMYTWLRLPRSGSLPGYRYKAFDQEFTLKFVVPPILFPQEYDPRLEDWCEVLYDKSPDRVFMLPVTWPYEIPHDLDKGSEGFCTRSKYHRVLEDLEVARFVDEWEWVEIFNEDNRRRLRILLKRQDRRNSYQVCSYKVLDKLPDWYLEMFAIPNPEWLEYAGIHSF